MSFEEVLKIVKQSKQYQGFSLYDLTDASGKNILTNVLKLVYDIAEADGLLKGININKD